MIEIDNQAELPIDTALLEKIAAEYTKRPIELLITDDETIRNVNKTYRGVDKPTDVLSFPFNLKKNAPLGSIVISKERVLDAARRLGHTPQEECALLFLHGLLHLLGYDHERDDGEMRRQEKKIVHLFRLPKSLIVRNEA